MTTQPPINPHAWRKFEQAQDNFRNQCGFHTVAGRWKFNGNRMPKKSRRRQLKWGAQMQRWLDKLF